jgi:hypothetical protein
LAALFKKLSIRSPVVLKKLMQNPIIKKSFLFIFGTKKPSATKESKKFSKIDNATPPKTPSQVFAGLIVF